MEFCLEKLEGISVATWVGKFVGNCDGTLVGISVGKWVGITEGRFVGN